MAEITSKSGNYVRISPELLADFPKIDWSAPRVTLEPEPVGRLRRVVARLGEAWSVLRHGLPDRDDW